MVRPLVIKGSEKERAMFKQLLLGHSIDESSDICGIPVNYGRLLVVSLRQKNRAKTTQELICRYYINRLEQMKQKITNIKERYKYVNKRRQGTVYND